MPVSEDFVEFLAEGAVAIEVYGHKQLNHRRNLALWDLGVIQAKTRTLRERCSDTNTQPCSHLNDSIKAHKTHNLYLCRCSRLNTIQFKLSIV